MKTHLRGFIISLSIFIGLFLIALTIPQLSILSSIDNLSTISILLLISIMFLAGILDGFNPCAFSTLLIWIGFLLSNFGKQINEKQDIKEKQKRIYTFAFFYALGIFITYLLIGTGLLMIGDIINPVYIPLITRLAGFIIVILGLLMIRDILSRDGKVIMKMPKFLYPVVQKYSKPTTKFASFISGVLIGLCTIPCSGAIYMAVIFILNPQPFVIKYPILFIYNIGFILPVVLLVITVSNRKLLTYLSQDFIKSKRILKIIIGIITVLLGLVSIYLV